MQKQHGNSSTIKISDITGSNKSGEGYSISDKEVTITFKTTTQPQNTVEENKVTNGVAASTNNSVTKTRE